MKLLNKRFTTVLIGVTISAFAIPQVYKKLNNNNNNNSNSINTIDHSKYIEMIKNNNNNNNHKKVLISGASGFIGTELCKTLKNGESNNETSIVMGYNSSGTSNENDNSIKYDVYTLVRRTPKSMYEIEWNPDRSYVDMESLEALQPDVVIHLAGENILGYWSEEKKKKIVESRTKGTRTICEAITKVSNPPKLFISASGCTYYGSDVYEPVDETFPKGKGFFSDVVEKWESSVEPIFKYNESLLNQNSIQDKQPQQHDNTSPSSSSNNNNKQPIRVVNLRIGLVLDKAGGLLGSMYYPFLFGLGGVIGSGKQYLPWISLRDAINIVKFSIENDKVNGPINVTSINPATNYEFTKTLGSVLNRPTLFWIPETPLRLLLGKDMSEETVLSSQRVLPKKLLDYGFRFQDTNLKSTLDEIINNKKIN